MNEYFNHIHDDMAIYTVFFTSYISYAKVAFIFYFLLYIWTLTLLLIDNYIALYWTRKD